MPKRMAFSKTIPQMRARAKTVTRRFGWWSDQTNQPRLEPGERVVAIEKGMGLRKGERQVVIGEIEVVSIRRERLDAIDRDDLEREGFPELTVDGFLRLLGGKPSDMVTRIEFRHISTGRTE